MKAEHFDSLQFGMSDHAAKSDDLAFRLAQANSTARDAARYRWLRDVGDATWRPFGIRQGYSAAQADAAIDNAIAAQDVEFVKPGAAFSLGGESK